MNILSPVAAALIASAALAVPATVPHHASTERHPYAEPSYSPDGREIAFASAGDIWTVSAGGGDAHLLVSGASNDHRPLYSPDGSRLAFMSSRNGGSNLYVLTLASGSMRGRATASGSISRRPALTSPG